MGIQNTIVILDDLISSFDSNFYYNAIAYIIDPLVINKDYIVTGTVGNANVGNTKPVTATVTMLNPNYTVLTTYTAATVDITKAAVPTLPTATRAEVAAMCHKFCEAVK